MGRFLQIAGIVLILCALPSLFAHQYFQGFLLVVVGGVLVFGTRLSDGHSFKKEVSLQHETRIAISEEGLMLTSPRAETKLNWSAFIRYTETKDLFMLYVQSRVFYVIPKRAFPAEDIPTLREMLAKHITGTSKAAGNLRIRAFLFALVIAAAIVLTYLAVHASRR